MFLILAHLSLRSNPWLLTRGIQLEVSSVGFSIFASSLEVASSSLWTGFRPSAPRLNAVEKAGSRRGKFPLGGGRGRIDGRLLG
jgi:hypothetical protein